MSNTLDSLEKLGVLRPLDAALGRMLARLDRPHGAELGVAGALVSAALGLGHSCLPLSAIPQFLAQNSSAAVLPAALALLPKLPALQQALTNSPLVAQAEQTHATPLVLDAHGRLYLRRYWQYERDVALALRSRAVAEPNALPEAQLMREQLARYFPLSESTPNWQALAGLLGLRARFCLIIGGPGTGKTSTVLGLLALAVGQALHAGSPPPRIALAAPTGKAAARMGEAIRAGKARYAATPEFAQIAAAIPEQAATLHRLLGYVPGSVRFRHDAALPLACDILVVDEASMVDLALCAKLLAALPAHARLIWLGDRDQLASVEAGNVLSALAPPEQAPAYSAEFAELALRVTGHPVPISSARTDGALQDWLVELRHNYRFDADGAIDQLARAVRTGDSARVLELFYDPQYPDIGLLDFNESALAELLRNNWLPRCVALNASEPAQALALAERWRILTALRLGPAGAVTLNQQLSRWLLQSSEMSIWRNSAMYPGRLVMITANDARLNLYNGDVGVALLDATGELSVWFRDEGGAVRDFLPATLPAHETAYAMTVHKAQGSEFDDVLLVLPRQENVAGRELLYTGVSRARKSLQVMATRNALRAAVQRRVPRYSGLAELMHSDEGALGARAPL